MACFCLSIEKFSEANICQYFLQGEYVKWSDNQKKILYHVNPVWLLYVLHLST